jgi:hypothetical protein
MKRLEFALLLAGAMLPTVAAHADNYDAQWVARCVSDNQNEKADIKVITSYCTCMNNKMSANETLSITAWEKTHPTETAACDKESGWK